MSRTEELIPGQEGLVRGVRLKAMSKTEKSTTCYRPVQEIILSKIVNNSEDCNETIEHDDTKLCE